MADNFQLFRLALLPRIQATFLEPGPDQIEREMWLRELFGQQETFAHHGTDFHFQPFDADRRDGVMVARLGRQIARPENRPPNEGLEDYTHEGWRAALVVLDPSDHEDGQKLAIQSVSDVGKPHALAKSLVGMLNRRKTEPPYTIEIGPILSTESFWDFERENRGNVIAVHFEFIAPNIWGGDDEFKKEMEEFRDSERARRVQLELNNNEGLNLETDRIHQAVEYAGHRGGGIRARAKGKKKYNSKNNHKYTKLEDEQGEKMGFLERARNFAQRILGRE